MKDSKVSKKDDPRYLARVEEWKAAQSRLREWMREQIKNGPEIPTEVMKDMIKIVGLPGTQNRTGGIKGEVIMALENGPLSELDIFNKWKIGRDSMNGIIRSMIKEPALDDRLWIQLDEKKEEYSIIGRGEMPEGWSGYLPPELKEL